MLSVLIQGAEIGEPQARQLLGAMLFSGDDVYKKVGVLSGGERHRLGLCRLFASRANTVILDEPTNHLDMLSVARLIAALQDYAGTILFVSHDREFIDELCTHILVMLGEGRSALFHGKLADYQRLATNTGFPDILQAHLQANVPSQVGAINVANRHRRPTSVRNRGMLQPKLVACRSKSKRKPISY